jgi:hypothetical protein
MSRSKTPIDKARLFGADIKNPKRFEGVSEPLVGALGDPPAGLTDGERTEWLSIASDVPWLKQSDRMLLGITCKLAILARQPGCPIAVFAQLRLCLASMGASPTDRGRIAWHEPDEYDPADEFIQ